jgi:succinate-acetate transporter protein
MAEVRIVVRPYASSLPLGFLAFGIGMLLLGGLGNGWLHASDRHAVGLLLVAFVFPLQALAAVIAFLARDAFGGTGLGMFSTSWLALGLTNLSASQDALSRTVGLYQFGFAFAVALLAVAAFGGKPLLGVIMLTAAVRAVLSGVYEWGGPRSFDTVAGWVAVGIFACAMYGGIAFLLEEVRKEEVLPVFRRGSSKDSFEGDLSAQLRGLADEAGVRQTL